MYIGSTQCYSSGTGAECDFGYLKVTATAPQELAGKVLFEGTNVVANEHEFPCYPGETRHCFYSDADALRVTEIHVTATNAMCEGYSYNINEDIVADSQDPQYVYFYTFLNTINNRWFLFEVSTCEQ